MVRPLVFVGPSGVGKSTLIERVMREFPGRFGYSISHTTRAARGKEVDGTEYHFTDRETVLQMQSNGQFLEVCEVHGNLYGTSRAAVQKVLDAGLVCVLDIDIQGCRKIKEKHSDMNAFAVFVRPPSTDTLIERIRKRGDTSEEALQVRLKTTQREMEMFESDPALFDFVVVNDDLNEAAGRLRDSVVSNCF